MSKIKSVKKKGKTFDPTLVKPKCVRKLYISCAKSYFLKKLEKRRNFSVKLLLFFIPERFLIPGLQAQQSSLLHLDYGSLDEGNLPFIVFLYHLYANCCFCRKNVYFSTTFWLYQCWVKNALLTRYRLFFLTLLILDTL